MALSDVIKTALDQIHYIARTETVVGEPITAGNVTLIPVSKVSIGFAAGGAGKEDKIGSGSATGGGATITPLAFITIVDDRVQVVPLSKKDPNLSKLFAMAPELIQKVTNFLKKDPEHKGKSKGPADR